MKLSSPPGLHYPITVLEVLKKRDDDVNRSERLFTYTYESTVAETDRWGGENNVKRKFNAHFDASTEGKISRWYIKAGTVVARPG